MITAGLKSGYFKENGFQGGIHSVDTLEEVRDIADKMCGKNLVTSGEYNDINHYTGEQGFLCRNVYVREELDIANQFFIQIMLDREHGCPTINYSKHGGVNYETIKEFYPDDMH